MRIRDEMLRAIVSALLYGTAASSFRPVRSMTWRTEGYQCSLNMFLSSICAVTSGATREKTIARNRLASNSGSLIATSGAMLKCSKLMKGT
jgi:hypothetical protein